MSDSHLSYYELLGLRREATLAEIRRAFKRCARRLHPAVNPGDPAAALRFASVSRAFEVLSSPEQRRVYDQGGSVVVAELPDQGVDFAGFDFSTEAPASGAGFKELFAEGDLGPPAPTVGEDLEHHVEVTFAEAMQGATRRLQLVRFVRCLDCDGEGLVAAGPEVCRRCEGSGQVRTSRGHLIFTRGCSACAGTGQLDRIGCRRCAGEGRLMQSEAIEVGIPAGIENGGRLRLAGNGNAGRNGGPPGDFVVIVEVAPHHFYRREGSDLFCEVPISFTEAALGAHIEVSTPTGPVTIEVPAGTQTGQRFRLRKRGVPRLDARGRGDLYIEARVRVPRLDDERSRELLRELAKREDAGELRRNLGVAKEG